MRQEQLRAASRMWKSGESGKVIAKTVGIKVNHLFDLASRYRHMFPKRNRTVGERPLLVMPPELDKAADELPAGRMRWVTEEGAFVTLPKISFIQCPRVKS